jgi:hypothetical protein
MVKLYKLYPLSKSQNLGGPAIDIGATGNIPISNESRLKQPVVLAFTDK